MSVNVKQSGNLIPIASLTKAITPVGLGDCYSTEERQVGCWCNGKPLYQKTYIFTSGSSQGWTVVDASPSNVDYIQVIECMVGGYSAGAAIAASACIFPYASASSIEVYCSSGYTNKSGTITVQYTKTTDTAGAGIWTPDGAYAEHYSTTEQVIGTWDGKPLYRRILPQITMNSGGYTYTHNIGIKYYINFGGHCTVNGTPSQNLPFPFYQNRWNGYCAIQSAYNNSIVFDATWNNNTVDCYIDYTKEADYT